VYSVHRPLLQDLYMRAPEPQEYPRLQILSNAATGRAWMLIVGRAGCQPTATCRTSRRQAGRALTMG
jgi:hypothetical protein